METKGIFDGGQAGRPDEGKIPAKPGIYFRLACAVCEDPFDHWKSGPGRLPKFCSDRCRKIAHHQQTAASQRGRKQIRPRNIERECVVCSAAFSTSNASTVTCGRVCGNVKAHRARMTSAAVKRARICEQCNASFREMSRSSRQIAEGKRQRFCSRACRGLAERLPPATEASSPDLPLTKIPTEERDDV